MSVATWNNYLAITWNKYLPPIRPYIEELNLIRKTIEKYISEISSNPKILILGSTSELRDIVYGFNLQPTVVDFSSENYEAMSLLVKAKGSDTFIEANWLELDFHNTFDIVLSEAAFNVIDADACKILYQKVYKCLKPNGLLIAKNWVRFSDRLPSLDSLISGFRKTDFSLGFYSYTCIPLMLYFYDYDNETIALKELNKKCLQLRNASIINDEEWSTIAIHKYENVELKLYIPSVFDFLNDLAPYFNVSNISDIKIAHSEYHPLFTFIRR